MGVNEYSNYNNSFTGVKFSDFKYKVRLEWPSSRWTEGSEVISNSPPFQDDVIPVVSGAASYASPNSTRTVRRFTASEIIISRSLIQDLRKNAKALEASFNFSATDPTYSSADDDDLITIQKNNVNTGSSPDPAGTGILDGIEKILGIELTGVAQDNNVTKAQIEGAAQNLERRATYNNYTNHTNYSNAREANGYVNLSAQAAATDPKYTNYYVNHSNSYGNGWWCCHRDHDDNAGNKTTSYLNYIVHYSNYSNANGPGASVFSTYINNG